MTKRRLFYTLGLVAVLLALPFFLWTGYAVVAELQGQHFYRGLPTSLWAKAVRRRVRQEKDWLSVGPVWLREAVGLGGVPAVLKPDPAAVPVLADLLADEDKEVLLRVLDTLGRVGPAARAAVPAIGKTLLGHPQVGRAAVTALHHIGPPSADVMPAILQLADQGFPDSWQLVFWLDDFWIGTAEAPALLARALRVADSQSRFTVKASIVLFSEQWVQFPGLMRVLKEAADDKDERVCELATQILNEIAAP
jgi:hypothetical protein